MILSIFSIAAVGSPAPPPSIDPWLGLVLGLLLVLLNGFFVAAEFALVKVRPTQVEPYAERGDLRGRILWHMVSHLDAYLSATQLGITLASLALGWIGEPAFAWILEPIISRLPGDDPVLQHSISLTAAFTVITILHIVIGELAPKSLAIRHPEPTSLWVALPLYGFFKVTYPVIWVLNHSANFLLGLVGVEPISEGEMGHSEEELRLLLASSHGTLTPHERELLDNVFELSDRVARQIMVPRGDVVFLSTTSSTADNLDVARTSGHTRFPLTAGSLDEVIGLVHIKDVFRRPEPPEELQEIARPIPLVPDSLPLDRLLRKLRSQRTHMAAVLDEFGGGSGIVTLENVIEVVIGEIQDEFDAETPDLVELSPGCYGVVGTVLVEELEEALGVELSDRDEDTIAGVVLSELGRQPRIGDEVEIGPVRFRVTMTEGNRIRALRVVVAPDATDS